MSGQSPTKEPQIGSKKVWYSKGQDYFFSFIVFILIFVVSSLPIIIAPKTQRNQLFQELFAANLLLALLSALIFFVALRITSLKHIIDEHNIYLNKAEDEIKKIAAELEGTKERIGKLLEDTERSLFNISEVAGIWLNIKTGQQETIEKKINERTKVFVKDWIGIISQWIDSSGKLHKRNEVEREFWLSILEKYMIEEHRDITGGIPSLMTNYSTYLEILKEFTELGSSVLKGKFPCFWALTNILPVNWYNMKHADGTYYNKQLREYRSTISQIISDKEIEFTRIFLTNSDTEYEIPSNQDLQRQMNCYIGWINRSKTPEEAASESELIQKIANAFGINSYENVPDGKEGYFIWREIKPTELHTKINGKTFYLNAVEKLGEKIINELHSKPYDKNALYALVSSGEIRTLPKEVTDFLIIGFKESKDYDDNQMSPIIGISCKLSLQPKSDMINLYVFGGVELTVLTGFIKKIKRRSESLKSLLQ